jgi:hypothetical protein
MDKQKLIKKLQKAADAILTVNDKLETPPAIASAIYGIVEGLADEIILECTKNDYVPIKDPHSDFIAWRRLTPEQRDIRRFVAENVPEFGSWLPETEEWKEWFTNLLDPVSSYNVNCNCNKNEYCTDCIAHATDIERAELIRQYNITTIDQRGVIFNLVSINTKEGFEWHVDRMPAEPVYWLLEHFHDVVNSKPNSP